MGPFTQDFEFLQGGESFIGQDRGGRSEDARGIGFRALEIDPLSLIINRVYGDMLLNARRYDEAIAQYRKTIEMDPNFPTTHNGLGRAYEVKGMYDQAVAEYLAFSRPNISPAERLARQETYTRSGWKAFSSRSASGTPRVPSSTVMRRTDTVLVRILTVRSLASHQFGSRG